MKIEQLNEFKFKDPNGTLYSGGIKKPNNKTNIKEYWICLTLNSI